MAVDPSIVNRILTGVERCGARLDAIISRRERRDAEKAERRELRQGALSRRDEEYHTTPPPSPSRSSSEVEAWQGIQDPPCPR